MAMANLFRSRVLLTSPRLMSSAFLKSPYQANSPAMLNTFHTTHHNNSAGLLPSKHWNAERVLSVGLIGIIPAAFLIQNPALDYALAASLVLHGHWGMEQVFLDYIHGETMSKVANASLTAISALSFAGLCYFNYNDVGLTKAVMMLWS
ncbi:succinate dehydrogenase [ubiquinone] cytochrome b small subunit B, mitochondrial-like [Lytechinus pictus]|uniref:succinate dehydrogenase [ubiquinone] cytochrome b small subunit B, mitochondrial-like n=1 Tax=Lytechinus pictus TaxID=7653 RepID=UPI00240E924C|nr:succinate dehydrogenase [ubiquinone] cytochrome b small subunit B, mitochondrial-like [Lytechinus pictus]